MDPVITDFSQFGAKPATPPQGGEDVVTDFAQLGARRGDGRSTIIDERFPENVAPVSPRAELYKGVGQILDDPAERAAFKTRQAVRPAAIPQQPGTPPEQQALAAGLRKKADQYLTRDINAMDAFALHAGDTAFLNLPRNVAALALSQMYGVPFQQAYDYMKDVSEAAGRTHPGSSVAGTVFGIGTGAKILPVVPGGATVPARAGRAALTGAGYAGAQEFLDSKDPVHAAVATGLGGALGLVAAPVAEKIVGLVSYYVRGGKSGAVFLKPDGTLTAEAEKAARDAGIDPAEFHAVIARAYAQNFANKGATPATARETAAKEFGFKLSPGEATGDYGTIAREQSMARDALGPLAGREARNFYGEREQAIDTAKDVIQQGFATKPATRTRPEQVAPMVETPVEAGNVVGERLRAIADARIKKYNESYTKALDQPGEFQDVAFLDIGERIRKAALAGGERKVGKNVVREDPVVINDKTTPIANDALRHLDETIGRMRIGNAAAPKMPPVEGSAFLTAEGKLTPEAYAAARQAGVTPEDLLAHIQKGENLGTIELLGQKMPLPRQYPVEAEPQLAGVSLRGLDQVRKELNSFYSSAKSSGNASDMRAMRRILNGFDGEVEGAIATGLFSGSDDALKALQKARKEFSTFQKYFHPQHGGDRIGRDMEKIVEHDATGGEIGNMLWGKAVIGEKGDSVRLAGRLKQVLRQNSDEWLAVKQGLWLRMTSKPEGMTDFGPQALSTRIFKFLEDGSELAKVVFTPQEIGKMRRFAHAMNSVTPPPGTVNYSNTAYTLMRDLGIGGALGGSTWWMTDDPITAGAVASVKLGGKVGTWMYRGAQARSHFSAGAPRAPTEVEKAAGRGVGVGAGLTAEEMYRRQ